MNYYDKFQSIKQTDSYDEQTALSLAIACHLAYQKEVSTIESIVAQWHYHFDGFKTIQKKPDIDTQAYVMSDSDNIVVVFRGSDALADWFANFQAVYEQGPLENTQVHEGFQDALFPAVIAITQFLAQSARDKKIWITGHSLGGALASLFAGMLIENGYTVYGIYTFASPRPGDGAFARQLNQGVIGPHYRVVNAGDIVPHVPPEPFYSHAGKRIIIKATHKVNSDQSWLKQRAAASHIFIEASVNMLDIANNHHLNADAESYIPRLIADLKRTVKL